jgi:hypothetical protein
VPSYWHSNPAQLPARYRLGSEQLPNSERHAHSFCSLQQRSKSPQRLSHLSGLHMGALAAGMVPASLLGVLVLPASLLLVLVPVLGVSAASGLLVTGELLATLASSALACGSVLMLLGVLTLWVAGGCAAIAPASTLVAAAGCAGKPASRL